ncbi:MAG: hypothetical protein Q8R06_14570 [Polaromonas sp.]|uniref:hypothetical protein n=1 Tax=Polaromonas sp. TaxID=1869339 RepID=UPI002735D0F0|nr:hypothetical protein [Polaromonas sp.]MDP3798343.1 hypothetical protein [Polaromonas sp.]
MIFGLLRRFLTCDTPIVGYRKTLGGFALGIGGTYIYFLFTQWNDSLHVAWLFTYPIAFVLFVAGQVLAILLGTWLVGLLIPPKDKPLCWEYYLYTFAGSALFWNDIVKGENSRVVQFIRSMT